MIFLFSLHFKLDSGFRFCHNTADERDFRSARATTGIGRHSPDSRSDLRQPELESVAAVKGVVRRMGMAQRKRPDERYGCSKPARETPGAEADRVAAAPANGVQPDAQPENTPAILGYNPRHGNARGPWAAERTGGQPGVYGADSVCCRFVGVPLPGLSRNGWRKSSIHGHRCKQSSTGLPAFRFGGVEVQAAGRIYRLESGTTGTGPVPSDQQHPILDSALDSSPAPFELDSGSRITPSFGGLATEVRASNNTG